MTIEWFKNSLQETQEKVSNGFKFKSFRQWLFQVFPLTLFNPWSNGCVEPSPTQPHRQGSPPHNNLIEKCHVYFFCC